MSSWMAGYADGGRKDTILKAKWMDGWMMDGLMQGGEIVFCHQYEKVIIYHPLFYF